MSLRRSPDVSDLTSPTDARVPLFRPTFVPLFIQSRKRALRWSATRRSNAGGIRRASSRAI